MSPRKPSATSSKTVRAVRLANRRRHLFVAVVLALLIAASLVFARPIYHAMKRRRAAQFALAGDKFFVGQHWPEAAAKYRAALQLDPANVVAVRGAARLGTRAGQVEAIEFWKRIADGPEMTGADHQQYARLCLRAGKLDVAEREIAGLMKANPDSETLALAGEYFAQQANFPKALEFARAAAKAAPNDDAKSFELANLLARASDADGPAEARRILWNLAHGRGEYRQAALEALAAAPDMPRDEQTQLVTELRSLPGPSAQDDLLAAGLAINLDPAAADATYEATIAKWRDQSADDRAQLGRWLNAAGQWTRTLLLLPADAPASSDQLLLVQLDALAGLKRWDEIEELLARKNLPLDASVAESFRARVAQERDRPLDADLHWNRAVTSARENPARLRFLAHFAEQSRAPAQALKIYEQLSRFPQHASFALHSEQRLWQENGDVIGLLAVTEKLSAVEPGNADTTNEVAYLRLLLERDIVAANAAAKDLATKYPDRLAFRVTRALGLLRARKASDALRAFEAPLPIDWQKTPGAWRAIYAATLAANGDDDRAAELARTIKPSELRPQERALVATLLPGNP